MTAFLPPGPNPAHQVRLAALPSKGIVPLFDLFPRPLMGPRPLAVVRGLEEGMRVAALRQNCIPGLDRAGRITCCSRPQALCRGHCSPRLGPCVEPESPSCGPRVRRPQCRSQKSCTHRSSLIWGRKDVTRQRSDPGSCGQTSLVGRALAWRHDSTAGLRPLKQEKPSVLPLLSRAPGLGWGSVAESGTTSVWLAGVQWLSTFSSCIMCVWPVKR